MIRLAHILCPVDFSECSRHALAQAVAIAKAHDGSVVALHAVQIPPPLLVSHLEARPPVPLGLAHVARERLLGELAAFTAPVHSAGVSIDVDIVDADTIHGEILAQAERRRSDLIVVGTHGRGGFQRLVTGSVAEKILRLARQPVLTVGVPKGGADEPSAFERILCAVDFSECSLAALGYAVSLADGMGARLTVVNVVEWLPVGDDLLLDTSPDVTAYRVGAETTHRQQLHKHMAATAGSGREVDELVTCGKPHHEILRIAAEQASDLIVMGIHGKNPIDRMFFGSTVEPVVRRATCPVLTVRAEAASHVAVA